MNPAPESTLADPRWLALIVQQLLRGLPAGSQPAPRIGMKQPVQAQLGLSTGLDQMTLALLLRLLQQAPALQERSDQGAGGDGGGYYWSDPNWKNPYIPPWASHGA